MSHTPHELAEEFPDQIAKMHDLKMSNPHFARLFEQYHDINRQIHRAETNIEPIEDLAATQMRKTRISLKDEIWSMLAR